MGKVNEQKRKLDVLAVVMNRGAKYTSQLELAKLIAGCIVWIELADCAKKIEHRVLNLVTNFFIEVGATLPPRPWLGFWWLLPASAASSAEIGCGPSVVDFDHTQSCF